MTSAKTHIPLQVKKKRNPWLSEQAIEIASKRKNDKKKGRESKVKINELTAAFQRQARLDKGVAINELCRELEVNSKKGRSRDLFKMLKKITGEFTPRTGHVKSKSG